MLVKEYRICLPLSVEEYRIAQLYMIQKKSREESSGEGSGVEIIINEPYTDGPGGSGQYTQKIYHIGSHLPGWFRSILPKSALIVEEEAWNAYPYTKTIYRCPFIEKFTLEIETVYHNDDGSQENVFSLSSSDLRNRIVDYLDIVADPISSGDYQREEDPRLFCSEKTGRGPLTETWRADYAKEIKQQQPAMAGASAATSRKALMCAYKLCKVEFRYWGMQGKIERFIHDIGLRKTMLRAHRQAWCWQDEYYGLTMEDIRRLERETQLALKAKMASCEALHSDSAAAAADCMETAHKSDSAVEKSPASGTQKQINFADSNQSSGNNNMSIRPPRVSSLASVSSSGSRRWSYTSVRSRIADSNIEKLQTSSSEDEDEFFDADDVGVEFTAKSRQCSGIGRSSSLELIAQVDEDGDHLQESGHEDFLGSSLDQRLLQYQRLQCHSIDASLPNTPTVLSSLSKRATILFLLLHGGSVLDTGLHDQLPSKNADLSTFNATLDNILRSHYPSMRGHIAVRLVPCPSICSEALSLLGSLTPYSDAGNSATFNIEAAVISENFPLSSVLLFSSAGPAYSSALGQVVTRANDVYTTFLKSDEGAGFSGQVCLLADCIGSLLGYDILCCSGPSLRHRTDSGATLVENNERPSAAGEAAGDAVGHNSRPSVSDRSSPTDAAVDVGHFDFDVSEFFMLGSSVGLVAAYRQLTGRYLLTGSAASRPSCNQLYNIFYSSHPPATRIEPLLHPNFKHITPQKIPRYQKFPYGDGVPVYAVETVQNHRELFIDGPDKCSNGSSGSEGGRRPSTHSTSSVVSGQVDFQTASAFINSSWWGIKRIDYSLYCPEALQNFPATVLPYLLHASLWESTDVIAFILRQVVRQELMVTCSEVSGSGSMVTFRPEQPREKWLKCRTTMKLRNLAPNHRANDVIVLDGKQQTLSARFMYGPLDVVSLSGEKIDIHIMTNPPIGKWIYFGTEVTDANGRATFHIPDDRRLPEGLYPVKMVVRGDHTWADFYMTVLPAKTDTAVFSIDGSFTASVSIMGKDPKVRPGAVDVVRHWHERGYLIIYITARPDLQQRMVVSWLAQHNFPHGMVAFMDGLSADPLRQKTNYLKQLVQEAQLSVQVAYGSSKDIQVYQAIGLNPSQIFIIGKVAKKHRKEAVVIADGYAAHLSVLTSSESSFRSPVGNLRTSLRKSCFSFPTHILPGGSGGKNPIRKTTSLPPRQHPVGTRPVIAVSEDGSTVVSSGPAAPEIPQPGVTGC